MANITLKKLIAEVFSENYSVDKDIKLGNRYKCRDPSCHKTFDTDRELSIHQVQKHKYKDQQGSFKCLLCPKQFRTVYKSSMEVHMLKKHYCSRCQRIMSDKCSNPPASCKP